MDIKRMTNSKALEALERIEYNAELDYGITIKHNYKDADLRNDYNAIRLALTELEAIKKTMQEWLESKDWSESLAWETLHKINYILKGETK